MRRSMRAARQRRRRRPRSRPAARVLAGTPRLILADEPTGQLDRRNADAVIDTLVEIAGDHGAALIVSTHDPHVAERFPTRWSVADGRLSSDVEVLR